ncbi:unnamed protein product [Caenorhabditis bovis]|uniref:Uncharacterized protein n=1 Tax=Caenorhabditis bovis TaxID=2654633 RepID=A0A8S1ECS4_9PELO|nr:unnamed protein product [Caenorhabditis bovis]
MENKSQPHSSELQALIAAIPHELSLSSPTTTTKSGSSIGDISSTSSTYLFPHVSDMAALSMLSLSSYPSLFGGLPFFPSLPYLNANLPPHATIESLGLINSAMYQDQRDVVSAMCSPAPSAPNIDTRPRAFSSAATLQHPKPAADQEKRRKRSRKSEPVPPAVSVATDSNMSSTSSKSSTSSGTSSSILMRLVEEDDVPIKKPITVTKEDEEAVQRKVAEFLKKHPIFYDINYDVDYDENGVRRPLRQIIRDEDLPDEAEPDSPFRHFPKKKANNLNP